MRHVILLLCLALSAPVLRAEAGNSGSDPVDLRQIVNFGFRDETANDGKGGWSDQGENDFRGFPVGERLFCRIPFRVIDPASNGGRSILSFSGGPVRTGLARAELRLPPKRKYLWLLHTLTHAPGGAAEIGSITFNDTNSITLPVTARRDVGDWWMPKAGPNALVALSVSNGQAETGAYVSCFPVPPGATAATLEANGRANWIVIAATASDSGASAARQKTERISAGTEWRPIDLGSQYVKPGSALDFSRFTETAEAGSFGRVVVNAAGKLAFEKRPELPVRFCGFVCEPARIAGYPVHAEKLPPAEREKLISDYADAVKRAGYNLLRLHFLDAMLVNGRASSWEPLPQTPDEIRFDPVRVEIFHALLHHLKKRGIYVTIDLMTSAGGYSQVYPFSGRYVKPPEFKQRTYAEPRFRAHWRAGAEKLLNLVNPRTGLRLADEPAVVFLHAYNEQYFTWDDRFSKALSPRWKEFRAAQGLAGEAPELDRRTAETGGEEGILMTRFITQLENGLNDFYTGVIRSCGYPGLVNSFNNRHTYARLAVHERQQLVTNNTYVAHPVFAGKKPSVTQASSLTNLGNTTAAGSCRFLDRPYVITEHNHAFWNRYRHEHGPRFGALAALQDWDGTCLHAQAVFPKNEPVLYFHSNDDPVIRVNEIIHFFAFLRGDVRPSPHAVGFRASGEEAARLGRRPPASPRLFPLSYLCRTGQLPSGSRAAAGLVLSPETGGDAGGGDTATLQQLTARMKAQGILPQTNATDPAKGIFESGTGEVKLVTDPGEMTIRTPRLEVAVLKRNRPVTLGALTVRGASVPAAVGAAVLDGADRLEESRRVLLTISTDALNSDMVFASPRREQLVDAGRLPVLVRCGTFELELKNPALRSPRLFALKFNGERLTSLPLTRQDGTLRFRIDTASLPEPAMLFELTEE